MPIIKRTSSGFIYKADFNGALGNDWIVSPSSGYVSTTDRPGYLRLSNVNGDVKVLFDPHITAYTFYAEIDYSAIDDETKGGIVFFKDTGNFVELLNYYDTINEIGLDLRFLKVVKNDDKAWFYGSTDTLNWNLYGVLTIFPGSLLGFSVYGDIPLDVNEMFLHRDDKVSLSNIPEGHSVEFYYSNNMLYQTKVADATEYIVFNIPMYMKGYFKVYDNFGQLMYTSEEFEFCGGDELRYDLTLELQVYNKDTSSYEIVQPTSTIDLGVFSGQYIEKKIKIINKDSVMINNMEVRVAPHSIFRHGYQLTNVTYLLNGMPTTYNNSINFTEIQPLQEIEIGVRIERETESIFDPQYAFNIQVRVW